MNIVSARVLSGMELKISGCIEKFTVKPNARILLLEATPILMLLRHAIVRFLLPHYLLTLTVLTTLPTCALRLKLGI
jgi:hypothetical protein